MNSFKQRPIKKINFNKKLITTLDTKHCEIMNEFNKNKYEKIPKIKKELEELNKQIKLLNHSSNNNDNIDKKNEINDKILNAIWLW